MNYHKNTGRAMVFTKPGEPFELVEAPVPAIGKKELLVKNLYTTLCGSDIHTFTGRRQEPERVVLGHEIIGEVLEIGEEHAGFDLRGTPLAPGARVTWSIYARPPGSKMPRPDLPQKSKPLFKYGHALAHHSEVFNGGMADYCILQEETDVVVLSNNLPLPVAAAINCAHATVAGALRLAGDVQDKRIVVVGLGLLGLSCLAQCKVAGAAHLTAVDIDKNKLLKANLFGANETLVFPALGEDMGQEPADLVFDFTGQPLAMELGLNQLAIGGTAVWIGAAFPAPPVQVNAEKMVRNILQIKGLHNYNRQDLLTAVDFIEKNQTVFPFHELVEKEFPLIDADAAFDFACQHKPVRTGIKL